MERSARNPNILTILKTPAADAGGATCGADHDRLADGAAGPAVVMSAERVAACLRSRDLLIAAGLILARGHDATAATDAA